MRSPLLIWYENHNHRGGLATSSDEGIGEGED